jgi:PadR family transcriptional regulator, regulatory protein PadR
VTVYGGLMEAVSLLKGTLDVLVLKALSWGPMHGFEVTRWLENRSDGILAVDDSALYQALHRMEERDLVRSEWGVTDNNRRARYYTATAGGRAYLRTQSTSLTLYARTVTNILAARHA